MQLGWMHDGVQQGEAAAQQQQRAPATMMVAVQEQQRKQGGCARGFRVTSPTCWLSAADPVLVPVNRCRAGT
jgi:hypothetical protein